MIDLRYAEDQVCCVSSFRELVSTPYHGMVNAICWERELKGDFAEIIQQVSIDGNITVIEPEELNALQLSEQGQVARSILLADLEMLTAHGASPVLNVIDHYDRDDALPFFPTDVYSFHVDRSPVPTDTFLCTYHGASSDILANSQGTQKILIPEMRTKLREIYDGPEQGFDDFLTEHYFDLHYQAAPDAHPTNLGIGNLWRLATDHPGSKVPPCLHRAPEEKAGERRLMVIC